MRKIILFTLVLACSVSMAFAAVDINADSMTAGTVAAGTDIGGAVVSGDISVEAASGEAIKADGTPYSSMIVLPEGTSLSFEGTAGETLKITAAVPADGAITGISVSSSDALEMLEAVSSDNLTAYSEYVLPSDGTYTLAPVDGSAYIYSIVTE